MAFDAKKWAAWNSDPKGAGTGAQPMSSSLRSANAAAVEAAKKAKAWDAKDPRGALEAHHAAWSAYSKLRQLARDEGVAHLVNSSSSAMDEHQAKMKNLRSAMGRPRV